MIVLILLLVSAICFGLNYYILYKQQKKFTDFWFEDSVFWKDAYFELWDSFKNSQNDEGEEWKR